MKTNNIRLVVTNSNLSDNEKSLVNKLLDCYEVFTSSPMQSSPVRMQMPVMQETSPQFMVDPEPPASMNTMVPAEGQMDEFDAYIRALNGNAPSAQPVQMSGNASPYMMESHTTNYGGGNSLSGNVLDMLNALGNEEISKDPMLQESFLK